MDELLTQVTFFPVEVDEDEEVVVSRSRR